MPTSVSSAARPEWIGPLRQKPAYGVYWYGPDLGMVGQQQRSSKQGRAFFSLSCFALIVNQLHSLKTNPKVEYNIVMPAGGHCGPELRS